MLKPKPLVPWFENDREVIDFALNLLREGILRIDSNGYIWRDAIINHGIVKQINPRRAENIGGKGYYRLTIQQPSGKIKSVMAHRVIWEWANGPIMGDLQVNHKDLNKQNNHLSNLELVTPSGNMQHSYANGRNAPWSGNSPEWRPGIPKLPHQKKVEICQEHLNGVSLNKLILKHGVSKTYLCKLLREYRAANDTQN